MSDLSLWVARALTPDELLERVRIEVDLGKIQSIQGDQSPQPDDVVYENGLLVPGLVDLQVNGGNGGAYGSGDPEECDRATAYHVCNGTTALLATVVTVWRDPWVSLASMLLIVAVLHVAAFGAFYVSTYDVDTVGPLVAVQ